MKTRIQRFAPFFLVAALGTAAAVTVSTPAAASSSVCTSPVQDIWKKYSQVAKEYCKGDKDCIEKMEKYAEIAKVMVDYWNKMVGGGWATIGPRPLRFGSNNDGTIIVGGQRLFISQSPVDAAEVEIRFKKEGGGAGVVTIAHYDGTSCLKDDVIEFKKSDPKNTVKTIKVKGTKGKILVVKVDAKDLDTFDYEFTAKKK